MTRNDSDTFNATEYVNSAQGSTASPKSNIRTIKMKLQTVLHVMRSEEKPMFTLLYKLVMYLINSTMKGSSNSYSRK